MWLLFCRLLKTKRYPKECEWKVDGAIGTFSSQQVNKSTRGQLKRRPYCCCVAQEKNSNRYGWKGKRNTKRKWFSFDSGGPNNSCNTNKLVAPQRNSPTWFFKYYYCYYIPVTPKIPVCPQTAGLGMRWLRDLKTTQPRKSVKSQLVEWVAVRSGTHFILFPHTTRRQK